MDPVPLAGIFVGFGLLVIVPVVAILTEHQRKMARILHGQPESEKEGTKVVIGVHASGKPKGTATAGNEVLEELRALRNEVADLRIQVASLSGSQVPAMPEADVRSQLTQG
ncbi:MAG TPA: hypothetical protein VHE55_03560 [Fimbriimonadaceae bacterium]|nr:hypothetical protein [Fimbriimonadaceae bacterium]